MVDINEYDLSFLVSIRRFSFKDRSRYLHQMAYRSIVRWNQSNLYELQLDKASELVNNSKVEPVKLEYICDASGTGKGAIECLRTLASTSIGVKTQ